MPTATILGTTYQTVIGPDGKEWLAENLRHEIGGNVAPPNGNDANVALYGFLYTRSAVDTLGTILTDGWRVALKADYSALFTALGGASISGGKLKATGTTYWNSPNTGATDEFGFSSRGSGAYNLNTYYAFRTGNRTWAGDSVVGGGIVEGVALGGSTSVAAALVSEPDGGYSYAYAVRLVRDYTPPSGFSGVFPAQSGSWRNASEVHVAKDGVWRKVNRIFVPVSGAWREVL